MDNMLETEPRFFHDRRALQAFVIARRQEGATWREINADLGAPDGNSRKGGYYFEYLKGITPRSVGGYAPDNFDPEGTPAADD